MAGKFLNSIDISNLITILSVCIGGCITYTFNNISEKKKFRKEQCREIYKLSKKNYYCIKKNFYNIIEVGSNEEECIKYARQYNLTAQKILEDYRKDFPESKWEISIAFQEELRNIKRPGLIPKYQFLYLDDLFNICSKEQDDPIIQNSISELLNEDTLDFFSLNILSTLLPYNELTELKKVIDLKNLNTPKFNLDKYFNKKKFIFYNELEEISILLKERINSTENSIMELSKTLRNINWTKDKKSGCSILEEFDEEKFTLLYREKYDIFSKSIYSLWMLVNRLVKVFYEYFFSVC